MSPTITKEEIRLILDVARYAPSVHNTQPWKIEIKENKLYVTGDPLYLLKDGDPTTRQTYISLGIFAEALTIGVNSVGYIVDTIQLNNLGLEMSISKSTESIDTTKDTVALLRKRSTDRSIYKKVQIPEELTKNIQATVANKDVQVHVVSDAETISTIADFTSKGILLAMSNPAFRIELSKYLILPWSKSKRGISVKSLYIPYILAILQPIMVKLGASRVAESKLEHKRWQSASADIIITSSGDMPKYWFEVGKVYLRISLEIEKAKLSQATSAAIVEASDFHEDVEMLLHTKQRIQSIIRIGKGNSKRHYSPRISVDELLT